VTLRSSPRLLAVGEPDPAEQVVIGGGGQERELVVGLEPLGVPGRQLLGLGPRDEELDLGRKSRTCHPS